MSAFLRIAAATQKVRQLAQRARTRASAFSHIHGNVYSVAFLAVAPLKSATRTLAEGLLLAAADDPGLDAHSETCLLTCEQLYCSVVAISDGTLVEKLFYSNIAFVHHDNDLVCIANKAHFAFVFRCASDDTASTVVATIQLLLSQEEDMLDFARMKKMSRVVAAHCPTFDPFGTGSALLASPHVAADGGVDVGYVSRVASGDIDPAVMPAAMGRRVSFTKAGLGLALGNLAGAAAVNESEPMIVEQRQEVPAVTRLPDVPEHGALQATDAVVLNVEPTRQAPPAAQLHLSKDARSVVYDV
eukprot:m.484647 g.484647  ORF g.484647 m.484647 type:complete len:301 (+) comp23475_c0_seq1:163-1065(+)